MADIQTNDSYPKLVENESNELILFAEVMNSSQLSADELKQYHSYLVNHEIRWRHKVPEADPDAILGVWQETAEMDFKGKTRMYAKGTVWGETEAQQKAQTLLKKWESEGKKFGISSQIWKLLDKNEKTKAILFREASLTPFQRIEDCVVHKIYEGTDAGKTLTEMLEEVLINEDKIEGIQVEHNENAPLVVNINIGNDGAGSDSKYAQAIAAVDQAVQNLKNVAGDGLGTNIAGDQQVPEEPAPSPEEFARMKGEGSGEVPGDQIQNPNPEQGQNPEEDEDDVAKKNKQRQKLNAFEAKNNMTEQTNIAEIKLFEHKLATSEKSVSDLNSKIEAYETAKTGFKDKIKEHEVAFGEVKEKLESFEAENKVLTDKAKTTLVSNEKLQARIVELELFPKRWKLAKLAGKTNEKGIKQYFNEISDFSEKQLDVTIAALENISKTNDSKPKTGSEGITGDVNLPTGSADSEQFEALAKKFEGDPEGFLNNFAPDRYSLKK